MYLFLRILFIEKRLHSWPESESLEDPSLETFGTPFKGRGFHGYESLISESSCVKFFEIASCSVVSYSLQPHRLQPARLLCPWNSPGKNTGVGYHAFSRGSSRPRDQTWVSRIASRRFTIWATREAQNQMQCHNPSTLCSRKPLLPRCTRVDETYLVSCLTPFILSNQDKSQIT